MSHVNILVIDEMPEDTVNNHVSYEWDYYSLIREGVPKTVGDVRKDQEKPREKYWAILAGNVVYRNPYRIMTPEQMDKLYELVLGAYEDDTEVAVFDVHI